MNKPNITKGEWKFGFNPIGKPEVGTNFVLGAHPMICSSNSAYFTKKERHANLKAISAVPEMIDALIKVRQSYQGIGDLEGSGENLMKLIPEIDKCLEKAGCEL